MSADERPAHELWIEETNRRVCSMLVAEQPEIRESQLKWYVHGATPEQAAKDTFDLVMELWGQGSPTSRDYAVYPLPPKDPRDEAFVNPTIVGQYYAVFWVGKPIAYYRRYYYRTVEDVIDDFSQRIDLGQLGEGCGPHYVIWAHGQIMATVREPDEDEGSEGNYTVHCDDSSMPFEEGMPWPGWPTHEEWNASGRGQLTFDPDRAKGQE